MKIITQSEVELDFFVNALKRGQTIVYPTETCYGLGCDATNEEASERVFAIKGRERTKSVLMIAADIEMVKQYVLWSETIDQLAKKYWPGALTIVLPLQDNRGLATGVTQGGAVAFRVSDYVFTKELVSALGRPLVSTSANVAGGPNPYTIEDVLQSFQEREIQPDIIIDAGVLPCRPPSTIIRVVGEKIEVVRQGEVVVETSF